MTCVDATQRTLIAWNGQTSTRSLSSSSDPGEAAGSDTAVKLEPAAAARKYIATCIAEIRQAPPGAEALARARSGMPALGQGGHAGAGGNERSRRCRRAHHHESSMHDRHVRLARVVERKRLPLTSPHSFPALAHAIPMKLHNKELSQGEQRLDYVRLASIDLWLTDV